VIPGSHHKHDALFDGKGNRDKGDFVRVDRFNPRLGLEAPILVAARAGDLLLWDSRTVHCNTPALEDGDPIQSQPELLRVVAYICMMPRVPNSNVATGGNGAVAGGGGDGGAAGAGAGAAAAASVDASGAGFGAGAAVDDGGGGGRGDVGGASAASATANGDANGAGGSAGASDNADSALESQRHEAVNSGLTTTHWPYAHRVTGAPPATYATFDSCVGAVANLSALQRQVL